jgi:hypothetical protein
LIKHKFKISTWAAGKAFMKDVENAFTSKKQERDGDLLIETDEFYLSCHFDSQKFSFIMLKIFNESLEEKFKLLQSKYV